MVSVIIPTYKRPKMLGRAIESVLLQTYRDLELIIVDDNNDNDEFRVETEIFMKRYEVDPRIKYIKHHYNKNGAAARNTGILNAKGEFLAFLDDDDYYLPDKIEKQINAIKYLDETWGGASCHHVRKYKDYIYKAISINNKENGNYCYEFLSEEISMPSSTLLFKKSVFEKVGYFDEQFYRHQDLEFLVRYFRHFKMAIVNETLLVMQVEGFRNFPSAEKSFLIKMKFLEKFHNDFVKFPPTNHKKILHKQWLPVAGFFFKERKYKEGYRLLIDKVFPNSSSLAKDLMAIVYYQLIGYFSWFKELYAFLNSHLFYYSLNATLNEKLTNK